MPKPDKCNTATLLRGRTYTIRSIKFERGVPKRIDDDDFLQILEDEIDEIPDGEGEVYAKPRFLIERDVDDPDRNKKVATRLSATRTVKSGPKVRRRRIPA